MPKLIRKGKEIEIKEGENLSSSAEELGIPFSCHNGLCGVCTSKVISGGENLTPLTKEEKELGMDSNMRLMCQCSIKKGDVEIE